MAWNWTNQTLHMTPGYVEGEMAAISQALREAEAERENEIKRIKSARYMSDREKIARGKDVETKYQRRLNTAKKKMSEVYDEFRHSLDRLEERLRTPRFPRLDSAEDWQEADARRVGIRSDVEALASRDPNEIVGRLQEALEENDRVGAWVIQDEARRLLGEQAESGSELAAGALANMQSAIAEAFPPDRKAIAEIQKARRPLAKHYNFVMSKQGQGDLKEIKETFGLTQQRVSDEDVPRGVPRRVGYGGVLEPSGSAESGSSGDLG